MLKLRLQAFTGDDKGYFADVPIGQQTTANIASPYANTSSSVLAGLTPEIKEYYSQYLIKSVGPNLVYAQFGDKEKLAPGHGMTIEWRKWNDFAKATTPLTEGVTPAPSRLSVNPIRKTLNQYGDWTPVTDRLQLTAIDRVIVEITEKHSENAKLTLDTLTREDLIAGTTNAEFAGNTDYIYNLKSKMTPGDVAKMMTYLKNNNAPKFDGSYVAIIHPSIAYDLMTNEGWIDVVKYADGTRIFNGEIGKLYGVRFVESTESKIVKAGKVGSGTAADTVVALASADFASTAKDITFASNTLASGDFKENDELIIQDVSADTYTVAKVTVASMASQTITLKEGAATIGFTPTTGDKVWLATSASGGADYFVCFFLGKGAYKTVDINGDNAKIIVKPNGYGDDPLEQRASVGWKVDAYAAAVTNGAYIFKFYCTSGITGVAAN